MALRIIALLLFRYLGGGVGRPRPTAVLQAEGGQAKTPDGTHKATQGFAKRERSGPCAGRSRVRAVVDIVNCFTISALPAAVFVAGVSCFCTRLTGLVDKLSIDR